MIGKLMLSIRLGIIWYFVLRFDDANIYAPSIIKISLCARASYFPSIQKTPKTIRPTPKKYEVRLMKIGVSSRKKGSKDVGFTVKGTIKPSKDRNAETGVKECWAITVSLKCICGISWDRG